MGNSPSQTEFHPPTLTPPAPRSVSAGGGLTLPNSAIQQQKVNLSHSAPNHNLQSAQSGQSDQRSPLKEGDNPCISPSRSRSMAPPVSPHFHLPQLHEKSPFSWGTPGDQKTLELQSLDSLLVMDLDPHCSIRTEDLSPSSLSPVSERVNSRRKAGFTFQHPMELGPLNESGSDPNNAMIQSGYEVRDDQDVLNHYDGPYEYEKDSLEMECPHRHPTHPSLEEDSITSSTTTNASVLTVLDNPTGVQGDEDQSVSTSDIDGNCTSLKGQNDLTPVTTTPTPDLTPVTTTPTPALPSAEEETNSCPSEPETIMTESEGQEDRDSPSSSGFVSDLDPSSLQTIQAPEGPLPPTLTPTSTSDETKQDIAEGENETQAKIGPTEQEINPSLDEDNQNMHANSDAQFKTQVAKIPHQFDDHCSAPIISSPTEIETETQDAKIPDTQIKEKDEELLHQLSLSSVDQIRESEPTTPSQTPLPQSSSSPIPPQNESNDLLIPLSLPPMAVATPSTQEDEIDLAQGKKKGTDANKYISVVQISACSLGCGSGDEINGIETQCHDTDDPPTLEIEPPAVVEVKGVEAGVIPVKDDLQLQRTMTPLHGKVVSTTLTREKGGCGSDEDVTEGDLFTQICLEDVPHDSSPRSEVKGHIMQNEKPKLLESESLDEFESLEEAARKDIETVENVTLVPVPFDPLKENPTRLIGSGCGGHLVISCNEDHNDDISTTPIPIPVSQIEKPQPNPDKGILDNDDDKPSQLNSNNNPSQIPSHETLPHPQPQSSMSPISSPSLVKKVTSFALTKPDKQITSKVKIHLPDHNIIMEMPMQMDDINIKPTLDRPQSCQKNHDKSSITKPKPSRASNSVSSFNKEPYPCPFSSPEQDNPIKNRENSQEMSLSPCIPPPLPPTMGNILKRFNGTPPFTSSPGIVSGLNATYSVIENSSSGIDTPSPPVRLNVTYCSGMEPEAGVKEVKDKVKVKDDEGGNISKTDTSSPTPPPSVPLPPTFSNQITGKEKGTPSPAVKRRSEPLLLPSHESSSGHRSRSGRVSYSGHGSFGGHGPHSGHGSYSEMNEVEVGGGDRDVGQQRLEESNEDKFVLIKERDQALEDLNNVESAFADVHRKYERSKGVLQNLKDNEIALIQREQELIQKIENRDRKLALYKEKAQEKLELMFQDYEQKIKDYEVENTRLRAQCRLVDMKLAALENDVEQKAKENAQLNALCNELISGQGNH